MTEITERIFDRYSIDDILDVIPITPVVTEWFSLTDISIYTGIERNKLDDIPKRLFSRSEMLELSNEIRTKTPRLYLVHVKDLVEYIVNYRGTNRKVLLLKIKLRQLSRTLKA